MRITTKLVLQWDVDTYIEIEREGYEYDGPVARLCGATPGMQNIANQQSAFSQQLVQQATSVFGSSSKVFNDLVNSLSPTLAAGPNQEGFSPAEKANLNSQAITQTGQAYKNAKAAVGNSESAQGGGNTGLISGARIGTDMGLAESAANQTSSELSGITQADYAAGRENYKTAVAGMERAPGVFGAATSAANAATNSQEGVANTENQISQQNQSWIQSVTGALGGIAGAATGSYFGKLPHAGGGGSGVNYSGGDGGTNELG